MRTHVYALDLLRFFAAFCVLAYHLGFFGWASGWGTTSEMLQQAARYEALAPFTWFGWVGVEIFFVISGFVIANSAHGRSALDFLKGRVVRLYPAAWICATLSLCAWVAFAHAPLASLLAPYARAMSLWIVGPWIDGVYWSLAVEIVFYALVFWVLVAGRIVRLTAMPWLLTALSAAYLGAAYTPGALATLEAHPLAGFAVRHADILLLKYGCYFAAGIWLWLMSRREMTALRYLGLALAVACGVGEIANHALLQRQSDLAIDMSMPALAPVAAWLAALAVIVAAARAPRLFEARSPQSQAALRRIGLMTYPLFLTHNVVGAGIIRTATELGVNQWAALALAVAAALGLAYVICATAEAELRKVVRAALDRAEGLARRALSRLRRPAGAPRVTGRPRAPR
jgi:exopolysaccharide production protein ExoZ